MRKSSLLAVFGLLATTALVQELALAIEPAAPSASKASTAEQAAAVLDLSKFPLVEPNGEPNSRAIASQSYSAMGKVVDVAKTIGDGLKKTRFKEVDGATFTEAYASAVYVGAGYTVSLTVFPGSEQNTAQVSIINHGNVDLKQLPVPPGAKPLYAMPASVAYVTDGSVEETQQACRALLLQQGWQPFGETSASFFVKSNAVRIQVMVSESPAQKGKTTILLSGEQLSVDLPALPKYELLQYSDSTSEVLFDSRQPQSELVDFFQKVLGKLQWKSTTTQPVRIDFTDHLIFRSPREEMIELKFADVDGITRVNLKYQTASQVAESEKRVDAQAAKIKKQRDDEMKRKQNPTRIAIAAPPNSKIAEKKPKSIEFSTATGASKAATEKWLAKQQAAGWTKSVIVDSKEAGNYSLEKGDVRLEVLFVDPGFIPGSISISVAGDYQLELID